MPGNVANPVAVNIAHIRNHFALSHETYGSPRMHAELKADGVSGGRHRIARLMRDNGMKALQKRRYKKTTDSDHGGPVAPQGHRICPRMDLAKSSDHPERLRLRRTET